jgi:P-type E1-E2 ATPase
MQSAPAMTPDETRMLPEDEARPWHALTAGEALSRLQVTAVGLSESEAAARLARVGPNVLPRPRRAGPFLIYLRQFINPLVYLLLGATLVSLAVGEMTDAAFIFLVLQFNAVIGTVQEWRAEASAEALDKLIREEAVALRGGLPRRIAAGALVPGDVVRLASGARVPADLRLLEGHELALDESLLTGESVPVEKAADAVLDAGAPLAERRTMLYAGTTVLAGRVTGVVAATARATELGRIAEALLRGDTAPPPLVIRLQRFSRVIGVATLVLIGLLGAVQLAQGIPLVTVFLVAVALAVAAIPEGLPVAITVALAIATNRMARRNVIVRALAAVEGLGACTMIASDKTGTLTCNELTVKSLRVTAAGVEHLGDTVDVAFLVLAAKLGLDPDRLRSAQPPLGLIPFEPHRRYAATFTRAPPGAAGNGKGVAEVHVKGAAEVVVPLCDGIEMDQALATAARMAADGYRVLAVARGAAPMETALATRPELPPKLELLGLVGLIDPVRPEVPAAVERCRAAGVGVCMITGDHPQTALAIARELGIAQAAGRVVPGSDLETAQHDPAAFDRLVAGARVFARVEPMQKLDIVQALQRAGQVVAVTGDGANDAPALSAADIGVAMGKDGTDVARGAADLILADDNFASIVGGIEEGRIAYDNVRKLIFLLITTGLGEIVLFLMSIAAGLPLPLFAVQLLWLNLVTNGIQDVALAFEQGEPGVLKRRPRPPGRRLFDRRMVSQVFFAGAYMGAAAFFFYAWCLDQGLAEPAARNLLLLLMVLFENVHAINARSEVRSAFRVPFAANRFLILAILGAQGLHIAAMYLPGIGGVLDLQPVSLADWVVVAAIALSLLVVMEVFKRFHAQREEDSAT